MFLVNGKIRVFERGVSVHMCFCYLLRSHLGLFTDFLVSVCGFSSSMVILFLVSHCFVCGMREIVKRQKCLYGRRYMCLHHGMYPYTCVFAIC